LQAGGALGAASMGQINSRVGVDVWVTTLVLLLITSAVAGLGMFDLFFRPSARGKTRVSLSSLMVNPVFWVNVLYQVTIVVVVVRLVALELELVGRKLWQQGAVLCGAPIGGFACCWLVARALTKAATVGVRVALVARCCRGPCCAAFTFSLIFNWAGSMVTWISMITPIRLIWHSAVMLDADGTAHVFLLPSIGSTRGNVVMLLATVAVATVSALVTLGLVLTYEDAPRKCLTVWRIIFLCSAAIEMACLARCVVIFRESTQRANYSMYCQATLFQRGGISLAICLRLLDVIPNNFGLSVAHMLVIMIGIGWFNKRAVRSVGRSKVQPEISCPMASTVVPSSPSGSGTSSAGTAPAPAALALVK
jgi:hypothetical protein